MPISKKETVLVVAAHPDDEVLGCGATLAKHVKQGDRVHVLILAEGLTSRDSTRDRKKRSGSLMQLGEAARKAHQILGTHSVVLEDFPDNRLDTVDLLDLIKVVESHVEKHKPSIVYTHSSADLNQDHERVHRAVLTACRPLPKSPLHTLAFFEVPSSTHWKTGASGYFQPNYFVEVNSTFSTKIKALQCYASEMRPWPHARSYQAIEALAQWRGSCVGVDCAEAFEVGRMLHQRLK